MDPPVAAASTNGNGTSSLISPILITDQTNNETGSQSSSGTTDDDDQQSTWLVNYWQQKLTDFNQLKLYDFSWLEPIKDITCQTECILQQILYPGIPTSDKAARLATPRPPDMLDEVLEKLRIIHQSSKKLIQLFRPFVQEIVEEESGTFVRLINRSDQLQNVFIKLKEKIINMKKLTAKDVRLDILLHNFKDMTKDRRLLHDHSIGEVMRKMAESIYNCKNGISLLCMETSQSTMIESDTSTLQQGFRPYRYYVRTIERLSDLVDQLAVDLTNMKCSRDCLFDDEFSCHLAEIMEMENAAPIFGTFKNYEQNNSNRFKAYLKDTKVLQQSYKHWKELRRQKYITDTFTKEHSISETNSLEFDPEEALDVLLQWDPFNSMSCIGHAVVSVKIFSLAESAGSSGTNSNQTYSKAVFQVASSRLNDLFHCLINASSSFHNVEVSQAYSYARHPSNYFCSSSGVSSLSGEQVGSYFSSFSSSHSISLSTHPINIPTSKIRQQNSTCDIEPTYEKEKASDGRIFFRFFEAISNLKQLSDMLVQKDCGHVVSKAFQGAFQAAIDQKLILLGFHQGAKEKLEKLGSIEASALRERRRDWERAFKVVVYDLLPWPKFLCDEIFSDNTYELKKVCFYEYATLCLKPLLEFADAACSVLPSRADRIFHQLYVHEILSQIAANISSLFSNAVHHKSEPTQLSFVAEVTEVLTRLEKAILNTLADFRCQVQCDKSYINQNEVDVHHLTCSMMSYVKELSRYRISLNSILYDWASFSDRKSSYPSCLSCNNSGVSIDTSDCCESMLRLFSCLETKLMEKSQFLKDIVAEQVFWINNLNYMIEEVASPQLKLILGEKWVHEQNEKIQGYLTKYEDTVLTEVLSCLIASRGNAEKRINSFKLSVEEICKFRASWKVPNPIWRIALRDRAWDVVKSVYTKFRYNLHPGMLTNSPAGLTQILQVDPGILIEEELEGLRSHLLNMFEG